MSQFGGFPDPMLNPFYFGTGMRPGGDPNLATAQALAALGQGYAPFTTFQPGVAGFGGGTINGLGPFGPLVAMGLNIFGATRGFMPGNFFGPSPNLAFDMRNRAEAMHLWSTLNQVAGSPTNAGRQRAETVGTALAMAMGADQASAASYGTAFGGQIQAMMSSPAGMMAVNTLGQMTGIDLMGMFDPGRSMAFGVNRMGLGAYRGDGRFGTRSDEEAAIVNGLMREFYDERGVLRAERTRNFTAGQIGGILATAQSANLLPGMLTVEGDGMSSQAAANAINTDNLKKRLGQLTPLFRLAAEMTGSEDTNELFKLIQTITGGAAGRMDARTIESQLSKVQDITRVARITLDQFLYIISEGSRMAQSMGFSATTGANASINTVQLATLASGQMQRVMGGLDLPGNLTRGDMVNEVMGRTVSALGSTQFQTVAAAAGILDDAERRSTGITKRLQAANPALYQALENYWSNRATESDVRMLRGPGGRDRIRQLFAETMGVSEGDIELALESRANADRGATVRPGTISSTVRMGQIIDKLMFTADVTGQAINDTLRGFRGNKAQLADEFAHFYLTYAPRTGQYVSAREAFIKRTGISATGFDQLYETVQDRVLGQPGGIRDYDELAATRMINQSGVDLAGMTDNQRVQKMLDDSLRGSGLKGQDLISSVVAGLKGTNGSIDSALRMVGMISRKDLAEALSRPLERVKELQAKKSRTKAEELELDELKSGIAGAMNMDPNGDLDSLVGGLSDLVGKAQEKAGQQAREDEETAKEDEQKKITQITSSPETKAMSQTVEGAIKSALKDPIAVRIVDGGGERKLSGELTIKIGNEPAGRGLMTAIENAPSFSQETD